MNTPAPLYPLRFQPILKRRIWGGRRLNSILGKTLGPESDYAESWEISDHGADESVIAEGPLAGVTLRELLTTRSIELMGASRAGLRRFPLLVKFLDAHAVLSVQVHPSDQNARQFGDDGGKTEAWVVIHAEPGSVIFSGLRQGVDRSAFAKAIESGTVEPLLHRFEPKPGDCVFIPAGAVHAIGAGIVLSEIQQSSDATFRVFDWNRTGPDGAPRALHIDQALATTNFELGPIDPLVARREATAFGAIDRLAACEFFEIERWIVGAVTAVGSRKTCTILQILDGTGSLKSNDTVNRLARGQTWLLPAAVGPCDICPSESGEPLSALVVGLGRSIGGRES